MVETQDADLEQRTRFEPSLTEKYPLDFDELVKGSQISAEVCENILRLNRLDHRYSLKLLALKQQVERELLIRNRPVTACCRGGGIVILEDADASAYNENEIFLAQRKLVRAHRRNMSVDVANLTADEKTLHERRLTLGAAMIAGIREARKIEAAAWKSDRPKIG